MSKQKFPPHEHDWVDQYRRDWRYVCRVCGAKSRNNFAQLPQFRKPLRLTSTHCDFTTGRVSVTTSTIWQDDTAAHVAETVDELRAKE